MKQMSILIMEDVAFIRKRIVSMMVEIEGVTQVYEAPDTATAWSLFQEHRPTIAVLDISVPGAPGLKNGIDLLKRIRQQDANSAVIMLTNYDTPQHRAECKKAGAAFFFDKANEFEELPHAVEQLLQQSP